MKKATFLCHCLIAILLPLIAAGIMFANKYRAIEARQQLQDLKRSLHNIDEQIRVADAEYAYLTRPTNLEQLVREKLELGNRRLAGGKIVNLQQLEGFFQQQQQHYIQEISRKISQEQQSFTESDLLELEEAIPDLLPTVN